MDGQVEKILDYLSTQTDYRKASEIADGVQIPLRRVRELLKEVRSFLEKQGFVLDSIRSKGYLILFSGLQTRDELRKLLDNKSQSDDDQRRVDGLMSLVAGSNEYWKLDDLADRLFISRSTIRADFQWIRQYLAKYSLSFDSIPYKGVKLKGEEIRMRQLLCDLIFAEQKKSTEWICDLLICKPQSLERKIMDLLDERYFVFTDIAMVDFLNYLCVMLFRVAQNKTLTRNDGTADLISKEAMQCGYAISLLIENETGILLNYWETCQIAIEILSKSTITPNAPSVFSNKKELMDGLLTNLEQRAGIRFRDTAKVQGQLSSVLEGILIHQHFRTKSRNIFYGTESEDTMGAMLCRYTKDYLARSNIHFGSGDAILLQSVFHNLYIDQIFMPFRMLAVGLIDEANEKLVEYFLPRKNTYFIKEIKTCRLYQLNQDIIDASDVLVSTLPIQKLMGKPVLQISPELTQADHQQIGAVLKRKSYQQNLPFFFPTGMLYRTEDLDLKKLASQLADTLSLSRGPIMQSLKQTFETVPTCHDNGSEVYVLAQKIHTEEAIFPILYSEAMQNRLIFLVNHRNPDRALFHALNSVLERISVFDLNTLTFSKLLQLIHAACTAHQE